MLTFPAPGYLEKVPVLAPICSPARADDNMNTPTSLTATVPRTACDFSNSNHPSMVRTQPKVENAPATLRPATVPSITTVDSLAARMSPTHYQARTCEAVMNNPHQACPSLCKTKGSPHEPACQPQLTPRRTHNQRCPRPERDDTCSGKNFLGRPNGLRAQYWPNVRATLYRHRDKISLLVNVAWTRYAQLEYNNIKRRIKILLHTSPHPQSFCNTHLQIF